MKFTLNKSAQTDVRIVGLTKNEDFDFSLWDKDLVTKFSSANSSAFFDGALGSLMNFQDGVLIVGLGDGNNITVEKIRRTFAKVFNEIKKYNSATIELDHFTFDFDPADVLKAVVEGLELTNYKFDKYQEQKYSCNLKNVNVQTADKDCTKKLLDKVLIVCDAMKTCRDLINEVPNVMTPDFLARAIQKDAKSLKGVTCKILNKAQIVKEKMGLLLSVNAGSTLEPRVVHLSYKPSTAAKGKEHIALVGKGITFDTGGMCLKPRDSMETMKEDMGGAATVYSAFKAAVQLNPKKQISCFLGITDNRIGPDAVLPSAIVTARNGKTVEILNTDAEGRLVLADMIDYACDFKPTEIIDAATLTGAVLVALGGEVCGIFGNNDELCDDLLLHAKKNDEYMWRLPIIPEYMDEVKGAISDLKNMGNNRFGGSAKAAAFLQHFVREDIPWAHLDIAGVASNQAHLGYCDKGGSGLIVRTIVDHIL